MPADCLIRLQFEGPEELEREFHDNLSQGRAFTRELHDVVPRQTARLLLSTPHASCEMQAEVVMVANQGPVQGVGLALTGFDTEARARLEAFVTHAFVAPDNDRQLVEAPLEAAEPEPPPDDEEPGHAGRPPLHTRQQQLREMPLPQQIKVARRGEQADRVALERMLGKSVWDALLRNPRITVAEVARIARKGTVPRPLLELIVDNAAWIKTPLVRRALLSNPKLSADMVMRVLKFAPRTELKAMVKNPAYPHAVRGAAKRMVGSG